MAASSFSSAVGGSVEEEEDVAFAARAEEPEASEREGALAALPSPPCGNTPGERTSSPPEAVSPFEVLPHFS